MCEKMTVVENDDMRLLKKEESNKKMSSSSKKNLTEDDDDDKRPDRFSIELNIYRARCTRIVLSKSRFWECKRAAAAATPSMTDLLSAPPLMGRI